MTAEYVFPDDSLCAGHEHPEIFDQSVDGETRDQQGVRHDAALEVCGRCPVRRECADSIDRRYDEGVKGGRVLGPLRPERYGGYGEVRGVLRRPKRAS